MILPHAAIRSLQALSMNAPRQSLIAYPSKIILFPTVLSTLRFDVSANATGNFKALEVTINDRSIFNPPPGKNPQLGSMQDSERKLNLTHEYLTAFYETNDSGGAQFALQLGLPLG
nr:uncharacterized protein CTRU02_07642 [Colletotrichum truncatum]KAF6791302.1 hypothetical protein CTRU02_07642 [Colletotrichum truncatum]